ncbi:alpha-L-glutamate ligase-like protein [Guyparkeria sp. SCN-R1]|uniref:alpha-L-glutamate ligase-like protein n=1 Tax=Guyparkeria sp. SCN-R1 TaxID=2341113 RepID=UPI000F64DC59|nr:alpha-L-glutamate ligase-like protein [Guyparkeria sp. SCN-R1]RRQ23773.1 alpha-L-glutamate ligase-like protein [Guyparkeria sp. SCN-R1]
MAINWPITPRRLKELGVLGMNQRNGEFIAEMNARRYYPLVDDKLLTKELAEEAGLHVPALYGVIRTTHEIKHLSKLVGDHDEFVIKPANGAGGDGILVIDGKQSDKPLVYRKSSGRAVSIDAIALHISNILAGAYSLGGRPDVAMIEYRVQFSPLFEKISFQGVPDIRTIVYRGYPVMAMVRLPTTQSDGKANLHQGAIGAGVDMAGGQTLDGVAHNRHVTHHPDTREPISGVDIPGWQSLLEMAAKCSDMTGLGFLGVDVVLDRDLGPLILELNARPGLSIQIANGEGLRHRIERVDRHVDHLARDETAAERAAWSRENLAPMNL